MTNPIRSTLIWALAGAFVIFPGLVWLLTPLWGSPTAINLAAWADAAIYAVLLSRWSHSRTMAALFPLAGLLAAALWIRPYEGFFPILIGVWSWIRSGICFAQRPMRAVAAELITAVGGALLVSALLPSGRLHWESGIWFFGLIQCLYFYIVPYERPHIAFKADIDSFEAARRGLMQVLER